MRRVVEARTMPVSVALALSLSGCGTTEPTPVPTPTPVPKAVIKVLIDPNPVIAESTGDRAFPWDFRFNLQLSDSGGVGFMVTTMQTTITSALSGGTLTSTSQNPFVGVKIAAHGQDTRQFHIGPYRMENMTREGRVNVKMNFVDDAGHASVYDGTVNVLYEGEHVRLER
jgi:hypothetical protein